jgi:proline iminopeptidase
MAQPYPDVEPNASALLDVGDGQRVYWETCGSPAGKAALVLHGGPGSGCGAWQRRLFDPRRYRLVLFDQRNCGRSTPHASEPKVDLSTNTTDRLVEDIEALRAHLGIDRWLVLGGSWGSALALTYAERHPARVSELVLFGVTTGARDEFDWLFRDGLARFFPEAWQQRRDALPQALRGGDVVEAYRRLLFDADPMVRDRAARAWCSWESATPEWPPRSELAPRFRDRRFALAFARIVTHYVAHDGWLGDGRVWHDLAAIAHTPVTLINGRYDFQSPLGTAWALRERLPRAELIVLDAGHSAADARLVEAIVAATDRYAAE